jgi:hypothetical protein
LTILFHRHYVIRSHCDIVASSNNDCIAIRSNDCIVVSSNNDCIAIRSNNCTVVSSNNDCIAISSNNDCVAIRSDNCTVISSNDCTVVSSNNDCIVISSNNDCTVENKSGRVSPQYSPNILSKCSLSKMQALPHSVSWTRLRLVSPFDFSKSLTAPYHGLQSR